MLIRPACLHSTLLFALYATPAAAGDSPRVRMCFVDQPTTAVRDGEVFDAGEPKSEEYVLRVALGQKLRLELQPVRRFGELAPPEGMRATLTWPDGGKQESKAPLLFDGAVAKAGDLLIRIAPADRGKTHYFRLTATVDKPTECSPGERLERYVGRQPEELWSAEPALGARLRKLLGKKYRQYEKRNATIVPIEKSGDALVIEGCATHMCGVEAASLFISLPDDKLHCLLLFDGKRAEVFSEDPQHLPPALAKAQSSMAPASGPEPPTAPTGAPAASGESATENQRAPLRVFKNRKHPPVENPIFAGRDLLGGWNGKAFTTVDFEKLAVPVGEDPSEQVTVNGLFKNATKVRFFRGAKLTKTARAGALLHATEQMYGEHSLTWPDPLPGGVIGVGGDWDPVPRKVVPGDKALLKDTVVAMLTKNGVKKASKPVISRVLQVDLDNDGADDFVVVAHRKQAYFLLALITPAKERAIQISFDKDEDGMDSLNGIDIFDANGDGKMEMLIDRSAIESHSVSLYELRDDKVVSAFSGE